MNPVTWAKWTERDVFGLAAAQNKGQLVTIAYSHYCELARWSLLIGGVDYNELGYAPMQHIGVALRSRVGSGGDHRSFSSRIRAAANLINDDGKPKEGETTFRGGASSVPYYIKADGSILVDSIEIANTMSGLEPFDSADPMAKIYDQKFGPLIRQVVYHFILNSRNRPLWDKMVTLPTYGFLWKYIWYWKGNSHTASMSGAFKPDDEELNAIAHEKLLALFEEIAEKKLRNRKGKYMNGDKLTVEDIVVTSLGAGMVMPKKYCGGYFEANTQEYLAQDPKMRKTIEEYRATDLGKYILEVYENERPEGLKMNDG